MIQFAALVKDVPEDKPIFVFKEHAYNSTVSDVLERHCNRAKIPVISVHGLRHTHASVLLFAGVSIASVARRLGHSSMTTTQKTYLHIIQKLENQDIDLVMRSLFFKTSTSPAKSGTIAPHRRCVVFGDGGIRHK